MSGEGGAGDPGDDGAGDPGDGGTGDPKDGGTGDPGDDGAGDPGDDGAGDPRDGGAGDPGDDGAGDDDTVGETDEDRSSEVELRPYDPGADREALWRLKRAFELELGAGTGDAEKADRYEGKLTDAYRERYLRWVDRCVASDPRCVTVAAVADDAHGDRPGDGGAGDDGGAGGGGAAGDDPALAGYAFVLPWDLAMIWDAAVLNEIYVREPCRGTGVADDLLDAAVALARDQDPPLPRLVLDVDRSNDRARAFYERHGFEHWGEMVAREL